MTHIINSKHLTVHFILQNLIKITEKSSDSLFDMKKLSSAPEAFNRWLTKLCKKEWLQTKKRRAFPEPFARIGTVFHMLGRMWGLTGVSIILAEKYHRFKCRWQFAVAERDLAAPHFAINRFNQKIFVETSKFGGFNLLSGEDDSILF